MTLLLVMNLHFAWGSTAATSTGAVPPVNSVQPLKPLSVGRV